MRKKFFFFEKYIRYSGYTHLPVIEHARDLFPHNHLKDVYIIACQHILPSTHMMIRSMIDLGLDSNKIAVIGKCYSSNQKVMENMLSEGIFVCPSSIQFDPDQSFDLQFQSSISSFLHSQIKRMQPPKNAKIIILDDGGVLLSAAQGLTKYYTNIYGVEQTSSGYRKVESLTLGFPVINVAQSEAKLNFESPLIANSVMDNLEKKLGISSLSPKEILLIGNGFIGTAIRQKLRMDYKQHNVTAYDIVRERSEVSHSDFSNYDLIIGATGYQTVSHNYYKSFKKGAILVNVASSDREFDAVHFRKLSGKIWNTHDNVLYNGVTLLNCGFPLNFNGEDSVSIPLKDIQLVCALLFLGVCESVNYNQCNHQFIELGNNSMNSVVQSFSAITQEILC